MKAKEFLERADKAKAIITARLAEIERYNDMAQSITVVLDNIKVTSTHTIQDRMAEAAVMALDASERLLDDIAYYNDVVKEINNTIEQLPVLYYQVLHGVHIQGKYLIEIADDLNKSYSAITTANGRALKELDRLLESRKN